MQKWVEKAGFRRGLLLAGVALGLGLTGCSASASENRNPTAAWATDSAATPVAARPAPLDSLAPAPLAPLPDVPDSLRQAIASLHAALAPQAPGLRLPVLERACVGYLALRQQGKIARGEVLAVADMDLPNTTRRLWVLDLNQQKVLHQSYVAHGRGSGGLRAQRFSNRMKSACTALGFYRTLDTYQGSHGLSRRLRGLDKGQNSNAESRYVVLHAADYASPEYVQRHGTLGYSRGCPALPLGQYRAIIKSLPEGSCLLLTAPGLESKWLDGDVAARQLAAHGWQ